MKFRVILPFKAGQVSANGNLYPENVIKSAIKRFNEKAGKEEILGGIVERNDLTWEEPTHRVLSGVVSSDDQIMFECETLTSKEGKVLEMILTEKNIEYLPIMEVPKDKPKMIDGVRTITEITTIQGISIGIKEEDDEHQ